MYIEIAKNNKVNIMITDRLIGGIPNEEVLLVNKAKSINILNTKVISSHVSTKKTMVEVTFTVEGGSKEFILTVNAEDYLNEFVSNLNSYSVNAKKMNIEVPNWKLEKKGLIYNYNDIPYIYLGELFLESPSLSFLLEFKDDLFNSEIPFSLPYFENISELNLDSFTYNLREVLKTNDNFETKNILSKLHKFHKNMNLKKVVKLDILSRESLNSYVNDFLNLIHEFIEVDYLKYSHKALSIVDDSYMNIEDIHTKFEKFTKVIDKVTVKDNLGLLFITTYYGECKVMLDIIKSQLENNFIKLSKDSYLKGISKYEEEFKRKHEMLAKEYLDLQYKLIVNDSSYSELLKWYNQIS